MSVVSSISAAMDAVASKKEKLHKAFLELQSHSSALVDFTVQWKELEDHFDNLDKLMQKRFEELGGKEKENEKEKEPAVEKNAENPNKTPLSEKSTGNPQETSPVLKDDVKPRTRLKSLCQRMNGKFLKNFLVESHKDLEAIRNELPAALRYAADPAKLVLQTLEAFFSSDDGGKTSIGDSLSHRRVCDALLESLPSVLSPDEVASEVKKDALKIATTWKSKLSLDADSKSGNSTETKVFLQLLASYGISKEFSEDELVELVLRVSRRRKTHELCRALQISHKIPDVVEKLSSSGRQIDAVHFVCEFGLVEKIPPAPLLKAYLKEAKRASLEIAKNVKNGAGTTNAQNNADSKEIASLKAITKCIEERKLESQMSTENLEKRVEQLEKAIANRKRSAGAARSQNQNKRPRVNSGGGGGIGSGGGGATGAGTGGVGTVALLPASGVTGTASLHPKPNPLISTSKPLISTPNPLLPTANPPNAFSLSKPADFYRPAPVASIPSYNLPGQGVYDRASQGIYQSPYGVGSNPASLSRSHLYPSDNRQSSLYGAGSFGGSNNYGSYNIGSGVPPATSYQSSYLH